MGDETLTNAATFFAASDIAEVRLPTQETTDAVLPPFGRYPAKRHTVFRQPSGKLYHEHLMGSRGFSGPSSLLYHLRRRPA